MSEVAYVFASVLMLAGSAFMVLASLGLVRLPDLYTRMQAATKAGSLGASSILLGTAFYFGEAEVTTRAISVIAFLLLTAPLAAHMIARAGYTLGVPLFKTHLDELRERFGQGTRVPGGTAAFHREEEPPRPEAQDEGP
jgi:multicomponent Na+:H+ antiporter subunit G